MLRRLLYRLCPSPIRRAFVRRRQRRYQRDEIAASNLFDRAWYLEQNPHVRADGLDPIEHYLRVGSREGRNPNPLFDRAWYLAQYSDVLAAEIDPLLHYARYGGFEGRDPNPLFSSDWYLAQNPEVAAARINPLAHYIMYGAAAGLAPNRLFKGQWYLEQYPEARASGMNPLAHYLHFGTAKRFDPNPWFDSDWYLHKNPKMAAAGVNPLAHYLLEGAAQGRAPSPFFKGEWYLENVPDSPVVAPRPALQIDALHRARIAPRRPRAADTIYIDIVADNSAATRKTIESLKSDQRSSLDVGRLTVIAPSAEPLTPLVGSQRMASEPAKAFAAAIEAAKAEKRHLLVLTCSASITSKDLSALSRAFDADPFVGYVVPRLAEMSSGRLLPLLPAADARELASYDRKLLEAIPASILAPEFMSGCILIRDTLIHNVPNIAAHFDTMEGALRATMAWGRRLGFRALIANRVVLPLANASQCAPKLVADEQKRLVRFFPDSVLADIRFRELACHYREALLARALSPIGSERRQLLFDCSGMSPVYNGTSECALGILDGVTEVLGDWQVSVYAPAEAIAFHRLHERYPRFTVLSGELTGTYTVVVKLSQPWTVQSIRRLHRHALHIVFLMLDTIAWDIIYAAGPEVESAWALAADHADALLHISHFTKDRFNFRFAVAPHVRQMVTHLSFHYGDYVPHAAKRTSGSGHILVVGNDFEHKALASALMALPRAFPQQQFVLVGQDILRQPNVRSLRSGDISAADMEPLFANARMLVFPSFYEGFGFPVVRALGYGLDVIARRSDLLLEIGRHCAPRGRLMPFDDESSLLAVVDDILNGRDVETIPLGAAVTPGTGPLRWRDVAARILGLADELMAESSSEAHDNREAVLRFVASSQSN